jgi:uncharacterized membrane protein YgcG
VASLVAAAALNRRSRVTEAGIVVVSVVSLGLLAVTLASPAGLTMGLLPSFGAYAVSVVIAAAALSRRLIFVVAGVNCVFIAGDYLFQPHNASIVADARYYASAQTQMVALLAWPIALEILLAVIAYLWARGVDDAVRRADRSDVIVALEARAAHREHELQRDAHWLLDTFTMLASGNFHARLPTLNSSELWRLPATVNAVIDRVAWLVKTDFALRRTDQEVARLIEALRYWRAGGQALLPQPSGTPIDRLLAYIQQSGLLRLTPTPDIYQSRPLSGWIPPGPSGALNQGAPGGGSWESGDLRRRPPPGPWGPSGGLGSGGLGSGGLGSGGLGSGGSGGLGPGPLGSRGQAPGQGPGVPPLDPRWDGSDRLRRPPDGR